MCYGYLSFIFRKKPSLSFIFKCQIPFYILSSIFHSKKPIRLAESFRPFGFGNFCSRLNLMEGLATQKWLAFSFFRV
jgi:hypothetical protein